MDSGLPSLPKQVSDKKPIATVRYAMFGLIGLIALIMFIQLTRTLSPDAVAVKPTKEPAQIAPSEQVRNFQKQQAEQAAKIQQEAAAAKANTDAIKRQLDSFEQQQGGGEAPGVPPPTDQQRKAMLAGVNGPASQSPASSAERTAKQKAQEDRIAAVKAAQESSTVAVDFSDSLSKPATNQAIAKAEPPLKDSDPKEDGREPAPGSGQLKADTTAAQDIPQGRLFKLLEGTLLECVLTNRLVGSLAGPVNVMVTTPVYAHDHQTLLFPQGTRILGAVTRTGSNQDERLFVAFHRAILPTGYSVNLDQYLGLAQQGQSGLKDKVDRHYFQIFGASIALAAIEAGANAGGNSTSGGTALRLQTGVGQGTASASTHIIDQLLNRLPVFTIRERTRVKVYISKDLTLGAYDPNYRLDPL